MHLLINTCIPYTKMPPSRDWCNRGQSLIGSWWCLKFNFAPNSQLANCLVIFNLHSSSTEISPYLPSETEIIQIITLYDLLDTINGSNQESNHICMKLCTTK
uniref:Uncharacterized protein n=1 Tax=Trichobilharzia regenti TaxID=157069 RepID=A0AA85IUE7_TRIRE|nr:unnamed protein product [Trichobilharzia regenti]